MQLHQPPCSCSFSTLTNTTHLARPTTSCCSALQVHGDVFRPPEAASLLSTYVGVGVQIFGMLVITTIFALLGFLSPANRGGLMTAMVLMFVFMGLLAGYAAARLYKAFRGDGWKQMTLRTALMFPGVIFAMFFILDLLVWGQKSSGAVPFGTLLAICFLWFGVSVPLVFVGSYFGFKKPAPEDPVRTNKIPRQIPEQPWYMHPVFSCLVGGVLPFGAGEGQRCSLGHWKSVSTAEVFFESKSMHAVLSWHDNHLRAVASTMREAQDAMCAAPCML